jgi:hypothetical protein
MKRVFLWVPVCLFLCIVTRHSDGAPLKPLGPIDITGTVSEIKWLPEEKVKGMPGFAGTLGHNRVVPAHFLIKLTAFEGVDSETAVSMTKYLDWNALKDEKDKERPPFILLWINYNDYYLTSGMKIRVSGYEIKGDEGGTWTSYKELEILSPESMERNPSPLCLMQTDYFEMRLPDTGFTWLPGEELSGSCEEVPEKKWIRKPSGSLDLYVYTDGPSGSGRSWNVTVGVGGGNHSKAIRGICLRTSTVGWRTMRQYKRTPLPWLEDLDNDGMAEFIIWGSFPLHEDASILADYGLVAWVYRLASENTLAIDWGLSQQMAREIAQTYRLKLDSTSGYTDKLRAAAAEALELFADKRCSMLRNDAP